MRIDYENKYDKIGRKELDQGNYDKAISYYTKSIEYNSENNIEADLPYYSRAIALKFLSRYEEANKDFRFSLSLYYKMLGAEADKNSPNSDRIRVGMIDAKTWISDIYLVNKSYEDVIIHCDDIIRLFGEITHIRFWMLPDQPIWDHYRVRSLAKLELHKYQEAVSDVGIAMTLCSDKEEVSKLKTLKVTIEMRERRSNFFMNSPTP